MAIQKNADNYDAASGGKWDLRSLKLHMISQYVEREGARQPAPAPVLLLLLLRPPPTTATAAAAATPPPPDQLTPPPRYGVDAVDNLFWNIQMIILRSLFAVQPVMINDKHCFELYGYVEREMRCCCCCYYSCCAAGRLRARHHDCTACTTTTTFSNPLTN